MTTRSKSYHQTLERMQQSIRKFDHELEQSRMLTHDITIDNKTNKNLDFIIKVEDEFSKLEVSRSQSRVSIPQHSTYRHRISTSPARSNQRTQSPQNINKFLQKGSRHQRSESQTFEQSINRSATNRQQSIRDKQYSSLVRLQKKFQPLSRIQVINEQKLKESQKSSFIQSGVQIQLEQPFSNFSQVKQEWQPLFQPILESHRQTAYLKTPKYNVQMQNHFCQNTIESTVEKVQQQKHQLINLPVSVTENKLNTLFERISKQKQLVQEPPATQQQFKDNVIQQECLNISFNKFQTRNKIPIKSKQNKQWKVVPLGIGYQNNKNYFQVSKQKQLFKINKQKQRQKRLGLNNSRYTKNQSKSKDLTYRQKDQNVFSKIQMTITKAEKPSANDLFLQRKALLIQNLQKNNKKQKQIYHIKRQARSPAKTSYISQFTYKNISIQENRKRQISPKALQVSQRLYSRSKLKLKPCDHYQRFSQSVERQRFEQIIRQNSFVSRKISKQQKQDVFQCLRRSEDSVSTWPIKIMDYTYSKLQKIKVYSKSKIKTLV